MKQIKNQLYFLSEHYWLDCDTVSWKLPSSSLLIIPALSQGIEVINNCSTWSGSYTFEMNAFGHANLCDLSKAFDCVDHNNMILN